MNENKLIEMAGKSKINGFDESAFAGQTEAYQRCCEFVSTLEKVKTNNTKHSSYGLKHMVENPSGQSGAPGCTDFYTGYVYEGTFILAALSHKFDWKQKGGNLRVNFNISELSLKETLKRLTE